MFAALVLTLCWVAPQAPAAPAADDLAPLLRAKTFLAERAEVDRYGGIRDGRLVPPFDDNPALLVGPAVPAGLRR